MGIKKIISVFVCLVALACLVLFVFVSNGKGTSDVPDVPDVSDIADSEAIITTTAETEAMSDADETEQETTEPEQTWEETETSASETTEAVLYEPETEPAVREPIAEQPLVCTHSNVNTVNSVNATCASEGYSGDSSCADCGEVLSYGSAVSKTAEHGALVKRNTREATETEEGYTGDDVCSVCGAVVKLGEFIPKVEPETSYFTYTNSYGGKITVPENIDVLDYSLGLAGKSASSSFSGVEAEILRLINVERANAGLAPLKNEQRAFFFAKVRTEECFVSFSHTRPDGRNWDAVFADYNIFFTNAAENLAGGKGIPTESIAQAAVEGWMGSAGHRANILDPEYTMTSISVIYDETTQVYYATQHFFGN